MRYLASVVFAADGPIRDGVVVVDGDRIVAVERYSRDHGPVVDLGDVAMIPGLVNAHVHLDLSGMTRPEPIPFAQWLQRVIAHRRASDADQARRDVQRGIDQLVASGTVFAGDIAGSQSVVAALESSGIGGTSFREVVGSRPSRWEPLWKEALVELSSAHETGQSGHRWLDRSISPHAPHTTAREVYQRINDLDVSRAATHWLETPEEREFIERQSGPFAEFLASMGALPEGPPIGLEETWRDCFEGRGSVRWMLVHANFLAEEDLDRVADLSARKRVAGVVYCPRTHAYFGHPSHPWRRLRERGVAVALGTDSLGSNPDLSVFEEGRWLARHDSNAEPADILDMLTREGGLVLGTEANEIAPGRKANWSLLHWDEKGGRDPYEHLFSDTVTPVAASRRGIVDGGTLVGR